MSFSSLNLLVFQSSDSGLLRSASSASILKFEGEVEADGLDKEKEQHGPHGILSHLKSLTFGAKTMWRLLFCSFFYTFLIFEETPMFFAVISLCWSMSENIYA